MIALGTLVWFIVYVLLIAIVAYLLTLGVDWVVGKIPLPAIVGRILNIIIVVVAILIVLNMIIPFGGSSVKPLNI
jgi:hypothetical protein